VIVTLPCGRGLLEASVPDNTRVVTIRNTPGIADPAGEIRRGLKNPIGTRPLPDIIRSKRPENVCVVISDHTRPVPNKTILPPLLDILENGGISPKNITILIATGMHRETTHEEKIELVGADILSRYAVIAHDSESDDLVHFDVHGIQATVNGFYCSAGLKILTGFIEPHYMAGFSGGRKAICPGISGVATVRYFHSPALLESPRANPGMLDGNPCHDFSSRVAECAGADFMVNVTLNAAKEITGVFCGDILKAHQAGIAFSEHEASVFCGEPADIVVTTNGGFPLDRDLYQTTKGLVSALDIVREDGLIICASECCDGLGSSPFKRLLSEMTTPEDFLAMISAPDYFHMDQWGVEELVKVLKKARIMLYSTGLTSDEICMCRCEPIKSIEEGIQKETARLGRSPTVTVIPDGPYIIAKSGSGGEER